ncbi:vitelline membrane outer layer protein 1-like [Panulirus ornatus]|uniref:vitelline membrane outer layer protein 1-like n=1 Tax=Panulirus ornatus TaxID=150431 RepID=UPI003A8A4416
MARTGLLVPVFLLLLGTVSSKKNENYIILALDWAMNWGEWGPQVFCPPDTFTYAFQLKVETEDAFDDTAMNGIELYCRSLRDVGQGGAPPRKDAREFGITSTVDPWGDWMGKRECPQGLLTGLKMKSEEDQGIFDDTAANDLEMQCDWSTYTMNGGGDHWGKWSSWVSCPEGMAICGIETRVESQTATDDTALNDVRMFCCDVGSFNTTVRSYDD